MWAKRNGRFNNVPGPKHKSPLAQSSRSGLTEIEEWSIVNREEVHTPLVYLGLPSCTSWRAHSSRFPSYILLLWRLPDVLSRSSSLSMLVSGCTRWMLVVEMRLQVRTINWATCGW